MIERIGPFQCIESLGGGAAGQVYRAVEQMEGGITRTVALKVLPALPGGDHAAHARFIEEASSIIALSGTAGRHVVQCYSCGIEAQTRRPWISMQLIRRTLEELIGDAPSEPAVARRLLVEVLLGLHAMHSLRPPLVHNDLKPANILADDLDNFLIADFGLARRLSDKLTLPAFSARYAAPEIHQGLPGTAASDLYSLGHIAYELALGKQRFESEFASVFAEASAPQRLRAWRDWHLSPSHVVRPLDAVVPGSDALLARVVERLMAKQPAHRYASAAQVLAELGERTPDAPPAHADTHAADAVARPARYTPAPTSAPPDPTSPRSAPATQREADDHRKRRTTVLMATFVGICAACAVAVTLIDFAPKPVVRLVGGPEFVRSDSSFEVAGSVSNLPDDARIECVLDGRTAIVSPVRPTKDGTASFETAPKVTVIGVVRGVIRVSEAGNVLASVPFTLRREAPEQVVVRFQTLPPIGGMAITVAGAHVDAGHRLTTDANGAATCSVAYGKFNLSADHATYRLAAAPTEFDTGIDPQLEVALAVEKSVFDVRLLFPAGTDRAVVADANGVETPLTLAAGPVATALREGKYHCRFGSAQDQTSFDQTFEVTRSGENVFVLGPPPEASIIEPLTLSKGDRWAGLDARKVAQLSDADFTKYLKENVPLATIDVREPRPGMKQVRIEGSVLNSADLQRLTDRLAPASTRVVIDVAVNADFVNARFVDRLRSLGAKSVQVTTVGPRGADAGSVQWKLKVDFAATPGLTVEKVRAIGREYTLNDANLDVRRPY